MNVYDAAHSLAKAIKESDELEKFKSLQAQNVCKRGHKVTV